MHVQAEDKIGARDLLQCFRAQSVSPQISVPSSTTD
jgi:hypothetical protein